MPKMQRVDVSTDEDYFMLDDVDISDETELRRVEAEVLGLVGTPGKGLRLSVLSDEQWRTVLVSWLPPAKRKAAKLYMHVLRDPRDHQHLVVSPSCVQGINEHAVNIYEELIYGLLRCIPTNLEKGALLAGVDDIVARICGERLGVKLYARHAPFEADLVRGLSQVLVAEYAHTEQEWVLLLRRSPERFFLALRKTRFAGELLRLARHETVLAETFAASGNVRETLCDLIRAARRPDDPVLGVTARALRERLESVSRTKNTSEEQ